MFRKTRSLGFILAGLLVAALVAGASAGVAYRAEKKTVYYRPDLKIIVNGKVTKLDVEPFIVDPGWIMVPVEFVAKELGAKVNWNNETSTFTITTTPPQARVELLVASTIDSYLMALDLQLAQLQSAAAILPFVTAHCVLGLVSPSAYDAAAEALKGAQLLYEQLRAPMQSFTGEASTGRELLRTIAGHPEVSTIAWAPGVFSSVEALRVEAARGYEMLGAAMDKCRMAIDRRDVSDAPLIQASGLREIAECRDRIWRLRRTLLTTLTTVIPGLAESR